MFPGAEKGGGKPAKLLAGERVKPAKNRSGKKGKERPDQATRVEKNKKTRRAGRIR